MSDLDDPRPPVVLDATDRLPAPRRVLIEVTWEPWPGYRDVDSYIERLVRRHVAQLSAAVGRVAADVHVATGHSADRLPSARRSVTPLPYAELCERDAAASRAAWGDLEPDPTPSTGEQQ